MLRTSPSIPNDDTRQPRLLAMMLLGLIVAIVPQHGWANLELAKQRHCLSCHRVDRKIVGPAFRDIAARYKDAGAQAELALANKIQRGGGGAWGAVPMPAMTTVTNEEARVLARWVLEQR
ncbi:MAG TPA: c-type cytochrome [Burkholderiaceae bacterium]|nr:c-type cytochrome [Burkholderiaceae bacterium]